MKRSCILSIFCIFFVKIGYCQNVFTKIPTPRHNREVDIFFTHELPVKEPHFRTTMVEVLGGKNYNDLILKIKEKAQLLGADGVIIIEKDIDYLAGIGIKYNKNINQIFDTLNIIKKISIIPIDTKTISGDVLFDMDGKLKDGQQNGLISYFIENVFSYDFKFLVDDKSPRWRESTDSYGRIGERILYKTLSEYGYPTNKQKVVKFNYDDQNGNLMSLSISDKEDKETEDWRKEKLIPTYDEKGNLIDLKVFWKDILVRQQKLFYDTKKRLIMADWSRFEKGMKIPFLRVDYQYYQMTDLPK